MDCNKYNNYPKETCKRRRLVENCDKFNGKVRGNVCKIGKFRMAVSDNVFEYNKRFQDYKLMSPTEFLRITPPTEFRKENVDNLKEKIKKGEMDVLFLDVDVKDCKVLAHEGRNRAKASQELGIKEIPVVIFKKEFDPEARGLFGSKGYHVFSEDKMSCDRLKQQDYRTE